MPFKSNSTPTLPSLVYFWPQLLHPQPSSPSLQPCDETNHQRSAKKQDFQEVLSLFWGKVDSKIAHIRLGDFWVKLCWKDIVCEAFANRGGIWWGVFPISKRLSNATHADVCKTYVCYWGYFLPSLLFHFTFTNAWLVTDTFHWRYLKIRSGILVSIFKMFVVLLNWLFLTRFCFI